MKLFPRSWRVSENFEVLKRGGGGRGGGVLKNTFLSRGYLKNKKNKKEQQKLAIEQWIPLCYKSISIECYKYNSLNILRGPGAVSRVETK